MVEASVNLWELITTVASSKYDLPRSDACRDIQNAKSNGQVSELSLDIESDGAWIITAFDHDYPQKMKVVLTVLPSGRLIIERTRPLAGEIVEQQKLLF